MRQLFILFIVLFLLVQRPLVAQDSTHSITQINAVIVQTGALDTVAFSPDGKLMASGGRDNTVRLWDTSTGEPMRVLSAHTDWVNSVAFSPDGRYLASGGRDDMVYLWDVTTGEIVQTIHHQQDDITGLSFTPDSTIIASGSRDGTIYLHHIPSRGEIATLDNFGGPVWDIAFSPDNSTLASASEDGEIWLWGLWDADGVWLASLEGHLGPVTDISFVDDGHSLLSGGLDGTVRLWDVTNAEETERIDTAVIMEGHIAPVMGIGIAHAGGVAITASLDGTVRLWDIDGAIQRGKELATITGSGAPLTNLTINPTGTLAASTGTDGVLRLWDVSDETLDTVISSQKPAFTVPSETLIATNPIRGGSTQSSTSTENTSPSTVAATTETTQPKFPASTGPMLMIPSANIYSPIRTFYLDGTSWAIDPWEPLVGHLQGTAWLNNIGNMALGAHSEYPNGKPGLFSRLYNVSIGDEITIQEGDLVKKYVVVDIRVVSYDDLSVIYPTSHDRVTLITCDVPSFQPQAGLYAERLVVIADKVN